jgi:5-(carboxyamino)imidazole ribonucleotide mutase
MESKALNRLDSLLYTVQMPPVVQVGSLAIGQAGAINAALLAVQIISLGDPDLRARFKAYREEQARKVLETEL